MSKRRDPEAAEPHASRVSRASNHFAYTFSLLAAGLGLVLLVACSRKLGPHVPATPFATSFDPLEVIQAMAKREGLTPSIVMGGGSCSRGTSSTAGGPAITFVTCQQTVEFRSREDASRLTRAVFEELERAASAHSRPGTVGTEGGPENGEMHRFYCSYDEQRSGKNDFRGCLFLHLYAVERSDSPNVSYHFALDEERSVRPPAGTVKGE